VNRILFTVFLITPSLALAAKTDPAEYNVAIHVQSSHLVYECFSDTKGATCAFTPRLNVLIGGKKYELEAEKSRNDLIRVGDYKAKIVKDDSTTSYEYWRTYEFQFVDGTTRKYDVVGESQ